MGAHCSLTLFKKNKPCPSFRFPEPPLHVDLPFAFVHRVPLSLRQAKISPGISRLKHSLNLDAFKQNTWWDNVAHSRPGVPWGWWTWKKSFQISKSQKINWGYSGSPTPYHIHVQVSWGTWLVLHCYIQENMKWFERFFLSDPYQVRPWSAFVWTTHFHDT